MELIAHSKKEDGRFEPFAKHAAEVADLAAEYAVEFGGEAQARPMGRLHDVGKCSPAGQKRVRGISPERVEHAAAGAEVLKRISDERKSLSAYLLAYCVAGHHAGLPDGGVRTDTVDQPTLCAKLKRQARRDHDYAAYESALDDPTPDVPSFTLDCAREHAGFSYSFRTRMLFSCLVDADYLCTEAFMDNAPLRAGLGEPLGTLFERLKVRLGSFGEPTNLVGEKRRQVLEDCLRAAEAPRGLFTLTVPTGGGKTLSSLAFALRHALKNDMRRVIYVIPYTSIID